MPGFRFPVPVRCDFCRMRCCTGFPEAGKVAACIAAALKPGGRFVAEFGGKGNMQHVISTLRQEIEELAE